jgi:putative ABC transport system substrate-binding protein
MKKTTFVFTILFTLCFGSCQSEETKQIEQGKKKVVIITPMTHPSLDQSINGFLVGLAEMGFSEEKIIIKRLNASGRLEEIPSLAKQAVSMKASVVFVLSTPAAAQVIKITNPEKVPMVYTAVTDPIKSQIITNMNQSETFATGVSDRYPVAEQVKIFKIFQPTMKNAAVLYNPTEENSRILVEKTISELSIREVQCSRFEVTSASQITAETKRALKNNDCIIVNGDNLVIENLNSVIAICTKEKKPLFVGDPESVRNGAVTTVGPSYFGIGRTAGRKAADVLNGVDVRTIPSEDPRSFDYIVNTKAATLMGLKIPSDFWETRDVWESRHSVEK